MMVNNENNYLFQDCISMTSVPVKVSMLLTQMAASGAYVPVLWLGTCRNGFAAYLTCGEGNPGSYDSRIRPLSGKYCSRYSSWRHGPLDVGAAKNTVPLNKDAYPGKTIIITSGV